MKLFPTLIVGGVAALHAAGACAGDSLQHNGQSLENLALAVGHSTAAGFKLVSGAAAIPLKIGGAFGEASGQIGDALWESSSAPVASLPISDEIVTAGPPPQRALQNQAGGKP